LGPLVVFLSSWRVRSQPTIIGMAPIDPTKTKAIMNFRMTFSFFE
jgi:hypothetical protein